MTEILITGGTGFLGQALVRHLLAQTIEDRSARPRFDTADISEGAASRSYTPRWTRICIYSRSEVAQAKMRAELHDPDERCRWFIGDVRDLARLTRAMSSVKCVVHAAALKRVEVGEYNPTEMVRTNVGGAEAVIQAAIDAGVSRVVAISTDKACEPLNCYGATKLVAEKLFIGANNAIAGGRGPRFSVVRYGNVAGSTGSVIPTWRQALERGQPLEIRNPECTRFWMTVEEAVDMVMNVLTLGMGGELVVPDLPAYQLNDLVLAMGAAHVALVNLRQTKLGEGEKVAETLVSGWEAREFERVGGYWSRTPGKKLEPLQGPLTSDTARRLTIAELTALLKALPA